MAKRWLAALPVFNEVGAVGGVLDEVRRYADHILTVDDGSTDASWNVVTRLAADDSRVSGIRFRRNFGKAAALTAGMRAARGSVLRDSCSRRIGV